MPSVEYRDSAGVCWPIDMRGDGQLAGVGYPLDGTNPVRRGVPDAAATGSAGVNGRRYDRRRRGATLVGAVRAAAHSLSEWVADTYEE
jgi:hypothetical protein